MDMLIFLVVCFYNNELIHTVSLPVLMLMTTFHLFLFSYFNVTSRKSKNIYVSHFISIGNRNI